MRPKRLMLIFLLVVFITGCYRGIYLPGVKVDTNIPFGGSGVVVTNNMPGSELVVKKVGFHSSGIIAKKIKQGESIFIRADYVIDQQEMVITVVGKVDSVYIGSRSRRYNFYPRRQRLYYWDVNYLKEGRY